MPLEIFLKQQSTIMEMLFKSDHSDSCKNYGQGESRGNSIAGPATFPTLGDAGAGKGHAAAEGMVSREQRLEIP